MQLTSSPPFCSRQRWGLLIYRKLICCASLDMDLYAQYNRLRLRHTFWRNNVQLPNSPRQAQVCRQQECSVGISAREILVASMNRYAWIHLKFQAIMGIDRFSEFWDSKLIYIIYSCSLDNYTRGSHIGKFVSIFNCSHISSSKLLDRIR